jgi:hypothetical protein
MPTNDGGKSRRRIQVKARISGQVGANCRAKPVFYQRRQSFSRAPRFQDGWKSTRGKLGCFPTVTVTVAPACSPADENRRIAGVAHFMANQGGFIMSFGDGHETGCTDRVERTVIVTSMRKDRIPRSSHGETPISGRENQIIRPKPGILSSILRLFLGNFGLICICMI